MKKKMFIIVVAFLIVIPILFLYMLKPIMIRNDLKKNQLIAHALGGIDGYTYTNSLEAFRQNYNNGIKIFEVDIVITSDNYLVCRHDWMRGMYYMLEQEVLIENDAPLSLEQFKSLDILSRYTAISFEELLEEMTKYKDVYIVLDTKSIDEESINNEYKLLVDTVNSVDKSLFDRIVPQIYNRKMLSIIKKHYDFKNVFYTLYQDIVSDDEVLQFARENKEIAGIVMSLERCSQDILDRLSEQKTPAYVHTINEPNDFIYYIDHGITGVYTDFLSPSIIKEYIIESEKELTFGPFLRIL